MTLIGSFNLLISKVKDTIEIRTLLGPRLITLPVSDIRTLQTRAIWESRLNIWPNPRSEPPGTRIPPGAETYGIPKIRILEFWV